MKSMNISTLVPKTAKITAAAVGAVLAGSLIIGTAEVEAGSWHTYGVKGAYAQGLASRKNARSYVKGYVKDTACDSRIAILDIVFGRGGRSESVTATQCGAVQRFSFNSQYRPVTVRECKSRIYPSNICGPRITIIP
jgi:hypothetical protein